MFNLSGKTALITGASGGIGGAIAKALAGQGAAIAISGTKEESLKALSAEIGSQAGGGNIHILPCNLSKPDEVKKLAEDAEKALGKIDILVCNAGITKDGLAMRMKDEDWAEVININLTSSFYLMRAALRGMMKNRWGRIIAITSVVGHMGNPGQANYCASKGGLTAMVKSIAAEVASRGITANCVAPGFIETAMTGKLNDEQKARINSTIPAGSMGKPEDVAASVAFLAAEEAKYVTGQTIHVNGGMLMA